MDINVIEVSTIIAIIGCFVGLAGWLSGRDKKLISDAQWKGSVDSKLDLIIGIRSAIDDTKNMLNNHSERITVAEIKISRMQKNIDDLKKVRSNTQ